MIIYLNSNGELTCETPKPGETVANLVDAVLAFCQTSVDCAICSNTCCSGLTVYPDNVFLRRLLTIAGEDAASFAKAEITGSVLAFGKSSGYWYMKQNCQGRCKFLSAKNRCLIYPARPLVCRLHVCYNIDHHFQQLKNLIYFSYREALRWELAHEFRLEHYLLHKDFLVANPTLNCTAYVTAIASIIDWAAKAPERSFVPTL